MEFDVQSVDLEQLADLASKGGIEALEELATTGVMKEPDKPDESPPEEVAEATPEAPSKAAEEVSEVTPAVPEEKDHANAVATKDGKGTIPYSVLKGARERASQTEAQNDVLRKQIDELTQRVDSSTPAAAVAASTDEVDGQIAAMQAKAEQLKDEFPELAELMTGQIGMLVATRQQLAEMQGQHAAERADREAEAQAQVAETIQEAIDGNPVLSDWKEKAGPEWQASVDMDAMLRTKPEWAEKTFSERFTKVVELVRVMNPEYAAVAVDALPATPATSTATKPQATPSDKRPPVNSLSDIPGGVPPAAGKREQLEELSGSALGNRFADMPMDQINAYLAELGT